MLFDVLANRQNIKARIQASLALLSYRSLEQLGGEVVLPAAWQTMCDCLAFKTKFSGSTTDLRYLDSLENNVLDLWLNIARMSEAASEALAGYLNLYAKDLLQ